MAKITHAIRGDTNYDAFDDWSWAHLAVGMGLGSMGASVPKAVLISALWETFEIPLKKNFPKSFPHSSLDSPANKAGDILAVALGCLIVRKVAGD